MSLNGTTRTTHVLVFPRPLTEKEVRRVQRALLEVGSEAYVVGGGRKPEWRPGWVGIDIYVTDGQKSRLRDIAWKALDAKA